MQTGMIKVNVFYPAGEGKKFDMGYYVNTHVPMVSATLGTALKGAGFDAGRGGGMPGSAAPFVAIANMYFNSMEEFGQAFAGASATLMADLPNFTDIEPFIQISEVVA